MYDACTMDWTPSGWLPIGSKRSMRQTVFLYTFPELLSHGTVPHPSTSANEFGMTRFLQVTVVEIRWD